MRVLERNAEITTRYGGGFVQSIDGLEGESAAAAARLVLLRQRRRVAGRRRRRPAARAARRSGGTTATGRRRPRSRPWSAPGRSRSPAATKGKRHPVVGRMPRAAGAACATVRGEAAGRRRDARRRSAGEPARSGSWSAPGRGCAVGPGRGADRGRTRGQRRLRRFDGERGRRRPASASIESGEARRGASGPTPASSPRPAATKRRRPGSSPGRRAGVPAAAGLLDERRPARPLRGARPKAARRRRCRWDRDEVALRLHAEAGAAAGGLAGRRGRLPRRAGRGRLPLLEPARPGRGRGGRGRAPGCSPAPARAVRAALWMGLTLALPDRRRQRARRQPRRDGARPARRVAAASARSTSPPRRSSTASSSACARSSCWSPSPSTRPASTPTGCCARCGRSPAARR